MVEKNIASENSSGRRREEGRAIIEMLTENGNALRHAVM